MRPDGPLVDGLGAWVSYAGSPVGGTVITTNKVLLTQSITEKSRSQFNECGPLSCFVRRSERQYPLCQFSCELHSIAISLVEQFLSLRFKDDTGGTGFINHRARVFVTTSNAAPGYYRLGIANSLNTITTNGIVGTDLATNATQFVVVKFNVGTGFSALWVNPVSALSPHLEAPDTFNPFILPISTFSFLQDTTMGTFTIDDLRVGGTFVDVVEVPSLSIVPSGSNVQISWPITCVDQVLESTPSLSTPSWSVVALSPAIVGGLNVVTVPASGTAFYRLRD